MERLQIASQWSVGLVPYGEVPTDRRRQDRLALEGLLLQLSGTQVADARRARPRGRVRSKRKSSGSAARKESETRLRRQLQHNIEKLERSEKARTELESRLNLYQDALTHRDQMINNVEVYSHQHHEEYQEHVNSEMEYMRNSLITAYNLLDEQSNALAEATSWMKDQLEGSMSLDNVVNLRKQAQPTSFRRVLL